jgi:hypothetical protein
MHVRVRGLNRRVSLDLRTSVQRRLWFVLGRFGRRIGRVTVDFAEREIPGRPSATRCRIMVNLIRSSRFCVEETGADVTAVVERAAFRVGQLVQREIDRQREGRICSLPQTYLREQSHGHELPRLRC